MDKASGIMDVKKQQIQSVVMKLIHGVVILSAKFGFINPAIVEVKPIIFSKAQYSNPLRYVDLIRDSGWELSMRLVLTLTYACTGALHHADKLVLFL